MDVFENISDIIKSSFCNITQFKLKKNGLEVITPYSTINNKFVSVFIAYQGDKIVITDNAWLSLNYYETPIYDDAGVIIKKVSDAFAESYRIKNTINSNGLILYYKSCKRIEEIPSMVFDLANFIVGVVNSSCIQYKDEKDEKDTQLFRTKANTFFVEKFGEYAHIREGLDDIPSVRFNTIIKKATSLTLVSYITGSTHIILENDIRKTAVNFELTEKSRYRSVIIDKISLINDESDGYREGKSATYLDYLRGKMTKPPVLWSERDKLMEYIRI